MSKQAVQRTTPKAAQQIYETYKNRAFWMGVAGLAIATIGLTFMALHHYHPKPGSEKFNLLGKIGLGLGAGMVFSGLVGYTGYRHMANKASGKGPDAAEGSPLRVVIPGSYLDKDLRQAAC